MKKEENVYKFNWLEKTTIILLFLTLVVIEMLILWLGWLLIPFVLIPDINIMIKGMLVLLVLTGVVVVPMILLSLVHEVKERKRYETSK